MLLPFIIQVSNHIYPRQGKLSSWGAFYQYKQLVDGTLVTSGMSG